MRWILQTRGGMHVDGDRVLDLHRCIEARHPWSAVAVRSGQIAYQTGPDGVTPWRSAAKPVQLATCLELLGDPWLQPEELAVGAASHSGQPVHLRWVREILARFDVAESDLRCAPHPPMHAPSADEVLRSGEAFGDIHNNCSGKHAFMLATASRSGWPLDYRPADHPLQARIAAHVREWTGVAPALALDGCGVPTFCLPLSAIARAWSVVAEAMADDLDRTRLGRIGRAMADFPELASGSDRFDASVVRHACAPIAAKIGAGGVFCIAVPDRGLGLAVKVWSGCTEALPAAVSRALGEVAPDLWQEPPAWRFVEVRNVAGRLAGLYVDAGSPELSMG
ncbi:MAG: asparaginase [Deltaproteobacteria bacterium]|nr:asparaginase [Deltaproteobacteria bacterium]